MSNGTEHQQFLKLYEPLHKRLQKFVQTLVWNNEEAKDILSETILISMEKFTTIREPEKLMYFMFSVAANLVKRTERRKVFKGLFVQEKVELIANNDNSESRLLHRELYELLSKLNTKQREAIVLFEINGFSIKEIAAIQNLSESGVKSNLKRGREKLQAMVKESPLELKSNNTLNAMTNYGK